ncbi:MAG: selenoneine biosynthesis selenosugar synthase SenB [Gemmatimonadota bacterium]
MARPLVGIVTPYLAASNTGNWHTAARWARILRSRFRVRLMERWDGQPVDCLIALHARRSAESIHKFAAAHPDRPLGVVLTGTDLYRDIANNATAQRSLDLASRLVVLNERGPLRLPRRYRKKTTVILQSARGLSAGRKPRRTFDIAVIGHLREEKNPRLVWRLLEELPADLRVRIRHAGAGLDEQLAARATEVAARDPRYRWLGNLRRPQARQLIRRSHVLLHPSNMEGGAQAVIEAVMSHTPVVGSGIDGNAGLLGVQYAGLFTEGDVDALRARIVRAAREPRFLAQLTWACDQRAKLFAPEREARAVLRLVDNLLGQYGRSTR